MHGCGYIPPVRTSQRRHSSEVPITIAESVIPTTSGPIVSLAPPSIAGEFAGRYTVERELGRGATSVVWLARDREHERSVAIKLLREELIDSATADRFLREVRVTAQLHHPHIVPVLHSGQHDRRLFVVLPYLDGGTLRSRLQHDKQLPISEVVAIGVAIASALAAAHEKNVLHRDVKPENILFAGGHACLADFGIARAIVRAPDESTTSTGMVPGTPAYMSPEQASGDRDYDGRTDIYSLACVLYEALAGVPAFVGATPAQIVAQRLLHPPRSVRVYRSTVSPELDAVLQKALATAPADRYLTARQFAEALAGTPTAPTNGHVVQPNRLRRLVWLTATAAVLATGLVARNTVLDRLSADWSTLDTSRVAILPFDGQPHGDIPAEDLLREAMRRWKGLSLVEGFQITDAIRRRGLPVTQGDARSLARALGAGRFLRGRVASAGGQVRIAASLFDTKANRLVYEVALSVPSDSALVLTPFLTLGDSLAVHGTQSQIAPWPVAESRNLPAVQSALRAMVALNDWDLSAAESLFAKSLDYEPTSNRAAFWTAQIRSWRNEPTETWRALANRAVRDSSGLTEQERGLAEGLSATGDGDWPRACGAYRGLVSRNSRSFAAWYGMAQCIDRDRVVVADSRFPSGWRFRSSYQRAIDAYVRAFELLPSAYRGYQGGAYNNLINLLFANGRNRRQGYTADSSRRFLATMVLDADSLAFVVDPFERATSGQSAADPAAAAKAVERARQFFHRTASAWASAFPSSAGAKEGLALSLELQGNADAIDTLASAVRLARDSRQRLQLVAEGVWLKLKLGLPDRPELLRAAKQSADSALQHTKATDRDSWEILSRFAALTGRCSAVAAYAQKSATTLDVQFAALSGGIIGDTQERAALSALGCSMPSSLPSLDELAARAGLNRLPPNSRAGLEVMLFGREIRVADPLDTTWARRLAPAGDYLIESRLALAEGSPAVARKRLAAVWQRRRAKLYGTVSPDAVVAESRILLHMRDTSGARDLLDEVLRNARYWGPMYRGDADNVVQIASAVRATILRAEVAATPRDAAVWARAALALWDEGDSELAPTIQKMKQLSER
jgi:serine/threonine protein kinase